MTGLEKIINSIKEQAIEAAECIKREATEEAYRIKEEYAAKTGSDCGAIAEAGLASVEAVNKISESGAELTGKKMLLSKRREIIEGVIASAVARLRSLPTAEYFAVIENLALRLSEAGAGEIILSAEDKEKLPANFEAELNKKLSNEGKVLTVSKETRKTGGGCFLCYGGIEVNCTFDALVNDKHDFLSDEISKYVFS
ncbi:MAG: V-type ATP synthase subunit E [Oscillospiraceae bacterium]|jgi:V/A-type H+-transporting ATPase subunit E|nr:V-type ATP synthase subunit E [Oscillospiraceae bacterium]